KDAVLTEYFRTAHEIMAAGHQLVLDYLGVAPAATAAPALAALPAPVAIAPAPVAAPAAPATGLPSGPELLARLTAIVSARTGYPEDMLGPDLDVEADLSIDSIKRLEILGELADALGLSDGGSLDQLEDLVEQLAARKTLRGIVEFLVEHEDRLGGEPQPAPAPEPAAPDAPFPAAAQRFVVGLAEAPLGEPDAQPGRAVRITGGGPVAARLADELAARGVDACAPGAAAGLVVVTDLLDEAVEAPELYRRLRPLLLDTAAGLLVVTPLGGGLGIDPPAPRPDDDALPRGAGARGLVKTAALEFPERAVRLVDVDPAADVAELACILADEVERPGGPVEVAWRSGARRAPEARPAPVPVEPGSSPLTRESVVLVTGGARGITARVAVALARTSGCRLELVGRTALPEGAEDPALAGAADRGELRRALIATGRREPRAVERACDRVLAEREVRATLAALDAAGTTVRYHQVDVRDRAALAAVVQSVYDDRGRLDGIVHGAGALDDHAIAD
ncbi:MAG TPA: SDR family NAD(P)-dependent oxidoreductase, partial [Acidimicrobiales bacterium]